jgi:cyclopropane-fatty-acyl-phospholipid synthase
MDPAEQETRLPSSTTSGSFVAACRKQCAICGENLKKVIDLPELPLTDTFCREPVENPLKGVDQRLLFCSGCGHGQLETQIASEFLYGANYCFRTSTSSTARQGTQFFLSVLDEVAPEQHFKCVLDLGCNDLFLLSKLKDRADIRIGIDPVWKGRESECKDSSITVYGEDIENIDLSGLEEKPDLIVCRHALEHIFDPMAVLKSMMEASAPDALFIFEVPGFDCLISRGRFDQIFHQHLQYFSHGSFLNMIEKAGGQFLLHRENYHDWGAMAMAFKRSDKGGIPSPKIQPPSLREIELRYKMFECQMATIRETLMALDGSKIYGYGAAQMLPVLAYHIGNNLGCLTAVLDDDPDKEGLGYWNLPVEIMPSSRAEDISEASVLITAVDNAQPILKKLLGNRPRHILYPFNII